MHLALILLSIAAPPDSAGVVPEVKERIEAPPQTWLSLRGGVASGGAAPAQVCVAAMPVPFEVGELRSALGLEACGNGSGFVHNANAPEIAHFRGRWRVTSVDTGFGWLEPTLSAGFAELQIGPDTPGFYFLDTGPGGVEVAGPEVGAAMGWAMPLGLGFEALAELSFSVAHFGQAPRLVDPRDPFQPSVAISAGLGW